MSGPLAATNRKVGRKMPTVESVAPRIEFVEE